MSRPGRVAVVGGGLAALRAIETLRREGHGEQIVLIGGEADLPYDRPPLSKRVLTGEVAPDDTRYRSEAFYRDHGVELILGEPASGLDADAREIHVGDQTVAFDAAILATGASPRRLACAQPDSGVNYLRTIADARAIAEGLRECTSVLVVGGGPIGSEVAASARARGVAATVVEAAAVPFARVVGEQIGAACAGLHLDHGTELRCGVQVEAIEGERGPERVRLTSGECIEAQLVVVGIGVEPEVAWLDGSGLELRDGLVCDATLRSAPGIYGAGDIVRWPNELFGAEMRCEQWTNAAEQGRHAAQNALSQEAEARPFAGSGYFWSDQYGVRLQFVGHAAEADEVRVVAGDVADRRFLALYRRGEVLVAAFAMNMPKQLMQQKLLVESREPWPDALAAVAGQPSEVS